MCVNIEHITYLIYINVSPLNKGYFHLQKHQDKINHTEIEANPELLQM